jgi:hypothetical protein
LFNNVKMLILWKVLTTISINFQRSTKPACSTAARRAWCWSGSSSNPKSRFISFSEKDQWCFSPSKETRFFNYLILFMFVETLKQIQIINTKLKKVKQIIISTVAKYGHLKPKDFNFRKKWNHSKTKCWLFFNLILK